MRFWNGHYRLPKRSGLVMLGLFCATICLLVLLQASEQHVVPTTGTATTPKPAEWGDVMPRALLSLVGIVALVVLLGFATRRFRQRQRGAGQQQLEVISSIFIGPKKQLVLARAIDRLLVLGVTESAITKLADLPYDSYRQPASGSNEEPKTSFDRVLSRWER